MARSAQQRFNDGIAEVQETNDAVREFVTASRDNHDSYSYAAGALEGIVLDLIGELPRQRRADMRERFRRMAREQKNQQLMRALKAQES
jgi:hypothetical protein